MAKCKKCGETIYWDRVNGRPGNFIPYSDPNCMFDHRKECVGHETNTTNGLSIGGPSTPKEEISENVTSSIEEQVTLKLLNKQMSALQNILCEIHSDIQLLKQQSHQTQL